MYPRVPQLIAMFKGLKPGEETRPLLLCEYAHTHTHGHAHTHTHTHTEGDLPTYSIVPARQYTRAHCQACAEVHKGEGRLVGHGLCCLH